MMYIIAEKKLLVPRILDSCYDPACRKYKVKVCNYTRIHHCRELCPVQDDVKKLVDKLHDCDICFRTTIKCDFFATTVEIRVVIIAIGALAWIPGDKDLAKKAEDKDKEEVEMLFGPPFEYIILTARIFSIYNQAAKIRVAPAILGVEYAGQSKDKDIQEPMFKVKVVKFPCTAKQSCVTPDQKAICRKIVADLVCKLRDCGIAHNNINSETVVTGEGTCVRLTHWDRAEWVTPCMSDNDKYGMLMNDVQAVENLFC